MLKICRVGSVNHTPFDPGDRTSIDFFLVNDITFVNNPLDCDLFVSGHFFPPSWNSISRKLQLLARYQFRRRVLVWTDEPWNMIAAPTQKWSMLQPSAHIMNVYTRDVHLTNFTNFSWAIRGPLPPKLLDKCPIEGEARIVGLVGYVANPQPRVVAGENRDLNHLRMTFMKEGWRRKRLDIFGPGWPSNMSKEDSRSGTWWERKLEILRDYDVCFAVENTSFDYYCTEKIWDSIAAGCLPIYYGRGNRIYETFPKHSFIDAASFADVGEIFNYIDHMSAQEYLDRFNRCVEVNNWALRNVDFPAERRAMLRRIVERVQQIVRRSA